VETCIALIWSTQDFSKILFKGVIECGTWLLLHPEFYSYLMTWTHRTNCTRSFTNPTSQ